ncbi:MAG: hypothetical protein J5U19_08350 [Candidatus Methanoperedens sp.]|nr:hypothetical protein [Candidatus Methanoperedens sp.]
MQFRKVIHVSGAILPLVAENFGKTQTLTLVFLCLILYLFVEILKTKISKNLLSMVYRENELSGFSIEPLSYFISVILLIYLSFFINEKICYAAIAILAAGDGFAGIMGRRYGKHRFPFNKNKSWEGSVSGFIAASITGYYYAGFIAIVGSVFGMAAGAINKYDNISVPLVAAIAMIIFQCYF